MQLIQITDMHLRSDSGDIMSSGVNTDASLTAVLTHMARNEEPPALLVATGDLVHDPDIAVYRRFEQLVEALDVPVVAIPGNHDDSAMMATCLDNGVVSCCGEQRMGNWHLLFLDTSVAGDVCGSLDQNQLAALSDSLDTTDAEHVLVIMHHHPYPVGSAWMDAIGLAGSGPFVDLVNASGRVRGVLCGHIHQEIDCLHDGVRFLGTPSTCVQFAAGSEQFALDDKPPAYRVITLNADGTIDTRVEWVPV